MRIRIGVRPGVSFGRDLLISVSVYELAESSG
jgi:hypothetical protein